MSVISAKCPNCGAAIQLNDERAEGFCSYCGSKVKVEEAQKLLIQGTVKVDTSDELANLYQIARRAKDSDNGESAHKYYDMILVKDPNSWEATFYVTYYQAMRCTIAEIWSAANSVMSSEESVLFLVKDNVAKESRNDVLNEMYLRLSILSTMFSNVAKEYYEDLDISIRDKYLQEYINNMAASADVMYAFGSIIITIWGDEVGSFAVLAWKDGINIHKQFIKFLADKETALNVINDFTTKIQKYDSSYQTPIVDTSNGCYVATAVYGSYDCPEVWTLRRYRDYVLKRTWYGRGFIKVYYASSPFLVQWFGDACWFKHTLKPLLDRIVEKLQSVGVSSTHYNDDL